MSMEKKLFDVLHSGASVDKVKELAFDKESLFVYDEKLKTPLGVALSQAPASKEVLLYLIEKGAAATIFSQGCHAADSLECTLSQNKVGFSSLSPDVVSLVDDALYEYVENLEKQQIDAAVNSAASGTVISTTTDSSDKNGGIGAIIIGGGPTTPPTGGPSTTLTDKPVWVPLCAKRHKMVSGGCHGYCTMCNSYAHCVFSCGSCGGYKLCGKCSKKVIASGNCSNSNITVPPEPFEPGDLVQLAGERKSLSKLANSTDAINSMGDDAMCRYGLVVSTKNKDPTDSSGGGSTSAAGSGTQPATTVSLAGCSSKSAPILADFSSNDLVYADLSVPGIYTSRLQTNDESPFQVGDRVVVNSSFPSEDAWCLGKAVERNVGVVAFQPTSVGAGSRCVYVVRNSSTNSPATASVTLNTEQLSGPAVTSGNPAAAAAEAAASGGFLFDTTWLDRAPAIGTQAPVVFAAATTTTTTAAAVARTVTQSAAVAQFKVGDRVQLNASEWTRAINADKLDNNEKVNAAKCLKSPAHKRYGVVVQLGTIKDNIQRNIVVCHIPNPSSSAASASAAEFNISLYSSLSLQYAHPFTISPDYTSNNSAANASNTTVAQEERAALTDAVANILSSCGMKADAQTMVNKLKGKIWNQIFSLANRKQKIAEFFKFYDEYLQRLMMTRTAGMEGFEKGWNVSLERSAVSSAKKRLLELDKINREEFFRDEPVPTLPPFLSFLFGSTAEEGRSVPPSGPSSAQNTWLCKTCGYEENELGLLSCVCCGALAEGEAKLTERSYHYKKHLTHCPFAPPDRLMTISAISEQMSSQLGGIAGDKDLIQDKFDNCTIDDKKNVYIGRKAASNVAGKSLAFVLLSNEEAADSSDEEGGPKLLVPANMSLEDAKAFLEGFGDDVKHVDSDTYDRELRGGQRVLYKKGADDWVPGTVKESHNTKKGAETIKKDSDDSDNSDSEDDKSSCDSYVIELESGDTVKDVTRKQLRYRPVIGEEKVAIGMQGDFLNFVITGVENEFSDKPLISGHVISPGLSGKCSFQLLKKVATDLLIYPLKPNSKPCCDKGHDLEYNATTTEAWNCARCDKEQIEGSKKHWLCNECAYNCCYTCQKPKLSAEQEETFILPLTPQLTKKIVYKNDGKVDLFYRDGRSETDVDLSSLELYRFCDVRSGVIGGFEPAVGDDTLLAIEVEGEVMLADSGGDELATHDALLADMGKLGADVETVWNTTKLKTLVDAIATATAAATAAKMEDVATATAADNTDIESDNSSSHSSFSNGASSMFFFEAIGNIDDLVSFRDAAGNTAAHFAHYFGLSRTGELLHKCGASRWVTNNRNIPPNAIADKVATLSFTSNEAPKSSNAAVSVPFEWTDQQLVLYKSTRRKSLLPLHLVQAVCCNTPLDYTTADSLSELLEALIDMKKEEAVQLADEAVAKFEETFRLGASSSSVSVSSSLKGALNFELRHAYVYKALALLDAGFGVRAASSALDKYFATFSGSAATAVDDTNRTAAEQFDPLAFFVMYMLWKEDGMDKRKQHRIRAAHCLASFRCFAVSSEWLDDTDVVDIKVAEEGIDKDYTGGEDEEEADDESDDAESMAVQADPTAPENQWKMAKNLHKLESVSMDKLMALTGMREVKLRAITVCKEVLLAKKRPAHIKATVSMNFLFVGNPGTGKTTVATLLSAAMVELGYRKNKTPVLTSANEILADQDPVALFQKLVESADNGTIFIDEAYNFNPAPPGSTANPSNKVLDHLMLVSETKRETMTFILAGYKEEIMNLLTYNPGFPSRFPKDFTFEFSDYSDTQLRKIFVGMVKERGMRLQPKKECGVSLSNVVAQRIGKGRGRKGFGNAREVRVRMEACIVEQMDRLGSLELLGNIKISDKDYATLTRGDVIGDRPDLENSPALLELDKMVGLAKVKSTVRGLMNLQLQNYDNEMRDDKVQSISLHRVFFGNAGTGKTTVARIYGRLLKEFGFLSDGDIIEVKPSDLIGQAMGESSTKTAAIIASAKGKVLFIDEAYGLDPTRNSGSYGSQCLDTLVEKIDGNAGVDMAVIMAGYEPQMRALFKNANNQGLTRRFNLDEAWEFEDFSDADLKKVLLSLIRTNGLCASNATVNLAISMITQRRRLDGFGNAAECSTILDRAKVHLANRKQVAAEARRVRDLALSTGKKALTAFAPKRGGGGAGSIMKSLAKSNNTAVPAAAEGGGGGGGDFSTTTTTTNADAGAGIPTEEECKCDPYLLIDEDFVNIATSAQGARDTLADLENMDNVLELLQDLEDTIAQAKTEGISAAKILDDCHMLFTGPPGTGKTTVAQRFGTMFRQLELLPTDHVEVITAGNLLSRYMGGTAPNVLEAMKRAKGGILFVDEAYGMLPKHGSYGAEAIQAFIDNITSPGFLGNLIVIFAGYKEDVEQLFNINPGFRSRFDKKRLEFNSWSADQATRATIKAAEQQHGYGMTAAAKEELQDMYERLSSLPDWGSAREVYKLILPAMYSKRARRLGQKQRMEKLAAAAASAPGDGVNFVTTTKVPSTPTASATGGGADVGGGGGGAPMGRRAAAKAKDNKPPVPPYEVEDVREAFSGPVTDRGGNMNSRPVKVPGAGQSGPTTGGSGSPQKKSVMGGLLRRSSVSGGDSSGSSSKKGTLKSAVAKMKAASAFTNAIGGSLKQYDMSLEKVIQMTSMEELDGVAEQARQEDRLLIVGFSAVWVKDTERVDLDDFAPKNPKVLFRVVMHSEETRDMFTKCGVTDMRIFVVFFRGKIVERLSDQLSVLMRRIAYWGRKCTNGGVEDGYGGQDPGIVAMETPDMPQQSREVTRTVHKVNVKVKQKKVDDGPDGPNPGAVWAALEEAMTELGYDLDKMEEILTSGDYPDELLQLVMDKTKCDDKSQIIDILNSQRAAVAAKVKAAKIELSRQKSEAEKAKLEKAKAIGRCPMDFEWIRMEGGFRCAGGTHFVTDAQVDAEQQN